MPEKARELSYLASNAATALALGNVDPPRDPYTLRAVRTDTASLQRADWEHNPQTGEWNRNVVVGFEQRGVPMTRPESATPERAAELNAASEQIIRDNIASGPAPIAARYELAYRAAGWQSFGEKLPAVDAALSADTLTASDGKQYRHNENGQWQREGAPGTIAQGNLRQELDNTRNALEPQIAQHKEQAATIPQWRPPTREEQDRDNLLTTYRAYGVQPDPEPFAAAMEAVERTRDAQGIDRATSSLSLERSAQGKYDVNSPINHLRADSAGVVRVAAVTSPDEIALAMVDLRAPPPLIPDTPELRIAALSPQQREAHEQALREANREGLSHDQVQQVTQQATVQAASPATPRAESIPIDRPPARTEAPSVTLSDSGPERERSFTPAPAVVAAASAVEVIPDPPQPKPEPPTQAETPPVAQPQAVAPDEAQTLTRSQPAAPAPDAAITPPSAATPPQDDTLRPGSQGQDVELLQFKLQGVGYRGPEGEPLPLTGQYDAATEQAVRQFQRYQGMTDTGMTDPTTQHALSAAQHARIESSKVGGPDAPALSQEPARSAPRPDPVATAEPVAVVAPAPYETHARPIHEHRPPTAASDDTPQVVRSPDRTAPDTPPHTPTRETAPTVEAEKRNESTVTAQTREPGPLAEAVAYAPGRAAPSRADGRDEEDQTHEPSRTAPNATPEPSFDLSQLSPKDQAMFAKIRGSAPNVSDETVALAMVEAKRNGIPDVDRLGQVGVADGTLWLGSVTPGYRAGVEANGPAPPMQDSLREAQALSQHYELQQAKERELAQQGQNQKQTDAMRPEL